MGFPMKILRYGGFTASRANRLAVSAHCSVVYRRMALLERCQVCGISPAQLLSATLRRIEYYNGSCFREFFALQRYEVLTEQGKKLPEAAGHTYFRLN
jgi:hypothetical protein